MYNGTCSIVLFKFYLLTYRISLVGFFIGNLIKDGQKAGEIASQGNITGNNQYGNMPEMNISRPKTLSDIGISAKQSSTFADAKNPGAGLVNQFTPGPLYLSL